MTRRQLPPYARRLARSAKVPAILFAVAVVLMVTLTALWNVVLVRDYMRIRELARQESERGGAFHWTFIAIGSTLFVTIIVLVVLVAIRLFAEIRWNRLTSGFVASVSHELNTPLSSIKLYAQTLARPQISEADRIRFAQFIHADVERLMGLVANILRAAQIDMAKLRLDRVEVPLRAYLAEYVDATRAVLDRTIGAARAVTVELGPGPDAVVAIDRGLFRQVLDNLVDNSVKYGRPEGCRIVVRTAEAGRNRIAVELEDDGIGMPAGELKKVFERFYRIEDDDPGRSRKGTGLGLSIVAALVSAHDGTVLARSDGPGRGTQVRIDLPIGPPPLPAPGEEEAEAETAPEPARARGAEGASS